MVAMGRFTGASFNPRTPCGVRPALANLDMIDMWFQSTHSLRSATNYDIADINTFLVSIHALLAECDNCGIRITGKYKGFNPRTPCGVRLIMRKQADMPTLFQSTHSLRSATPSGEVETIKEIVSIHALLAECDGI